MADTSLYGIEATELGVSIRVYVAPRSSSNKVVGVHNGAVKVALTAPPVEGAANKALVEFLAKTLGIPRGTVRLVSGDTSRNKVVQVEGIHPGDVMRKLALDD